MAKRRQGRMAKTQTVPVRLDPVLKWAAELAAGKERRSLNSFIEWAVEQAVKRVVVAGDETLKATAWEIANICWHFQPLMRIKILAKTQPGALTVKEKSIFQAMYLLNLDEHRYAVDLYADSDLWDAFDLFGAEGLSFQELTGRFTDAEAKIEARHGKQAPIPS